MMQVRGGQKRELVLGFGKLILEARAKDGRRGASLPWRVSAPRALICGKRSRSVRPA